MRTLADRLQEERTELEVIESRLVNWKMRARRLKRRGEPVPGHVQATIEELKRKALQLRANQ